MIGLVVVSHSRALAEAAVALAAGLLPDQGVDVRIAAGLHDGEFGTDAVAVADAIAAADSGDGVLVLMDLGSALLSAETALDLLDSPVRVRLSAAPLVEGLLSALAMAGGGADLDSVAREAEQALAAKRTQLGAAAEPARENYPQSSTGVVPSDDSTTEVVEVTGEHGLHARPAAELVAALRDLTATVTLRNATTGAGPVPADSLTRLLTLGVLRGQRLEVTASGPDAGRAVAAVRAATRGE
ncbi:HPr family phosphocarrier protein [Nocardia yunnanensis]|uniref:Phosphocarrier protein HPr n=1 Tax=Nocardia yunnanensis TaxID=2382165 RepID=A0A386ZEW8_9NOCA|nr:dihydroxyacetone kinase phosphoryl donor subunit DhaM [Nocardia yunnanensis]AYF76058.1 HPr family phosphocarrier protein [Nocardia yunnanensis]